MNEVNGSTTSSVLDNLSIERRRNAEQQQEAANRDELGQTQFLELMIAQLENQDPLSPQENGEFIAQLAQFSSVEQLDNLNNSFGSFNDNFMSSQALQASALVGRSVNIETDETDLFANGNNVVNGLIELPSSSNDVSVSIYNQAGALVETVPLGTMAAGNSQFRWDGRNFELNGNEFTWDGQNEEAAPPGRYRFEVNALVDGESEAVDFSLGVNVNSVTIGNDSTLTLNLAGAGSVALSDVKQIN